MYVTGVKNRIIFLFTLASFFALVFSFIDASTVAEGPTLGLAPETIPQRNHVLSVAPNNTQIPTFENPHNLTFFYAKARNYGISVNTTNVEGYGELDYVNLSLWDDSRGTEYWTLTYDEDSNNFSENDPNSYITLMTGLCKSWKSGDKLDILFVITINWDHPDISNTDTRLFTYDSAAENDTDWYETNWDFETRLDYVVSPSVTSDVDGTVDRGNLDETFHITGTVEYFGSSPSVRPMWNVVDVWVSTSQYGSNIGPWSDLTPTSGAFSVTCYADDALGQDTYIVKLVNESAGSGGSSLYHTTDLTDTYIADIVQVQSYSVSDARDNINDDVTIDVTLWYDHDDSLVTDGTVTINGVAAAHQGSGVWRITENKATVQAVTYNTVAVTGNTHGITTEDQNGQSTTVIWDQIVVQTTTVDDARLNINANAEIRVTLWLSYDSAYLGAGDAVTLDGVSMTWDAVNGWFDLPRTKASVGSWLYFVNSSSEATFGITDLNLNFQQVSVIWDSLTVSLTDPTDQRNNINTNASGMIASAVYDYDSTSFDGTLTLNNTQYSYSTAQRQGYTVASASGDSYDITEISTNDETFHIWDSLTVLVTDPTDQRNNINTNASGMIASAVYDYDGGSYDGSLTLNDTTYQYATSGKRGYKVASATGDDTYGITSISDDTDETYCIWDRLVVNIQADDNTPSGEQEVAFVLVVAFDYGGQICTTYTLVVDRNGTLWNSFTYSNRSSFADSSASISYEYSILQITSESMYGITTFTSNTETVVWSAAQPPTITTTTTTTTTTTPPITPELIIITAFAVCAVGGAAYFFFFRPIPPQVFVQNTFDKATDVFQDSFKDQSDKLRLLLAAFADECLRTRESEVVRKIEQGELTPDEAESRIIEAIREFAKKVRKRLREPLDALLKEMPEAKIVQKLNEIGGGLCDSLWDMLDMGDLEGVVGGITASS